MPGLGTELIPVDTRSASPFVNPCPVHRRGKNNVPLNADLLASNGPVVVSLSTAFFHVEGAVLKSSSSRSALLTMWLWLMTDGATVVTVWSSFFSFYYFLVIIFHKKLSNWTNDIKFRFKIKYIHIVRKKSSVQFFIFFRSYYSCVLIFIFYFLKIFLIKFFTKTFKLNKLY